MKLTEELQQITEDLERLKDGQPVDWTEMRKLAKQLDQLAVYGIRESIKAWARMIER